jgi:hypothetical protein
MIELGFSKELAARLDKKTNLKERKCIDML